MGKKWDKLSSIVNCAGLNKIRQRIVPWSALNTYQTRKGFLE